MAERISRQDLLRVCRDVARDFPAVQHVVTEEGAYFSLDLKVYNNFAPEVRNWIWRCELEMRNLWESMQRIPGKLAETGRRFPRNSAPRIRGRFFQRKMVRL